MNYKFYSSTYPKCKLSDEALKRLSHGEWKKTFLIHKMKEWEVKKSWTKHRALKSVHVSDGKKEKFLVGKIGILLLRTESWILLKKIVNVMRVRDVNSHIAKIS